MRRLFRGLIFDAWCSTLERNGWPQEAAKRMAAFLTDENGAIPSWSELIFEGDGPPPVFRWSCGHTAPAVCGQCYDDLTVSANALAEQVLKEANESD